MIRIKNYIFNENDIKVIKNDEDLLTIIFKDGSHRETQGTFDDIEWNYGSQDSQDVASKYLVDRLKLLEDACIKMQSSLIRLREENKRLKGSEE